MSLPDFSDFVEECLDNTFRDQVNESIDKQLHESQIPESELQVNYLALYSLSLLSRYHEWLKENL